ncbi:tail protein [Fundidesulfovibrio butyratiphilus]
MHRIDGPGAVNNLFSEGDPSVPQMATVVSAMWLNDVQENLVRAIEAAGITPAKGDFEQLRQAIVLLSGSGLIGEIRLWGSEALPATGDWMEANGPALNKLDYPALYDVWGDAWGQAPAGYFRGPDLRGAFVRGWDHGAGRDPDAATRDGGDHVASTQACEVQAHRHQQEDGYATSAAAGTTAYSHRDGTPKLNTDPTGGAETRPANIALMYIFRWR